MDDMRNLVLEIANRLYDLDAGGLPCPWAPD